MSAPASVLGGLVDPCIAKITRSSSLPTVLTEPEIILSLTQSTTQGEKLEKGEKRVFIFTDSAGFNPATNMQHPGSQRSVGSCRDMAEQGSRALMHY